MKVNTMKTLYLFTRKDCYNCPAAEQLVEEAMHGEKCEAVVKIIDADSISERLQFELLENQLFIFAVPTFVLKDEGKMELISSGDLPTIAALRKAVGS
jgi:protein-disulfide isomerase-like protein with CxxC motif